MIVAVVTEMLGAYSGLGWIIFQSAQQTISCVSGRPCW